MNKREKLHIWTLAGLMNIILIIIFSAVITFFPITETDILNAWISSPLYIALWIILPLLWIGYLIHYKILTGHLPSDIKINHLAFILLMAMVFITMSSRKSTVIYLSEGSNKSFADIAAKTGIIIDSDTQIELVLFDKERKSSDDETELLYESYINIIDDGVTNTNIIKVNHPLRYEGLSLYQMGWNLGVNEFTIRFNDIEYDIMNQNNVVIMTPKGNIFNFYPVDAFRFNKNGSIKVQYQWNISDTQDNIIDEGKFISGYIPGELKEYDFEIIEQDFAFISVFLVVYSPFRIWLALSSVIFLLALAYDLWIGDLNKKRRSPHE